jgi:hypothetical protein
VRTIWRGKYETNLQVSRWTGKGLYRNIKMKNEKPLCCGKMKNLTPPDQKKIEEENSLSLKRKKKSHVHCTYTVCDNRGGRGC